MDAVQLQQRSLKITKTYSCVVGIWPGQKKSNQYFLQTVIYFSLVTTFLGQITRVICFFNMDILTNQLFALFTNMLVLMKYAVHTVKNTEFKVLVEGMIKDMETDRTKEEHAIMLPYINRASFMTIGYAYGAIMCLILLTQLSLLPLIADVIKPLNTSRPRLYTFPVYYYFFDVDDYYYVSILHVNMACVAVTLGSIACDTFYISTVQHACGLFAIAGYRFKDAIKDIQDIRNIADISKETYKKVCRSIMAHDRAIRHVRDIDSFYEIILFTALGATVVSFSCVLLRLAKMKSSAQFYMYIIFSILELGHLFFLTIQGQFVSNKADRFYDEIYEGQWYNSVPKTQALFILALRAAMNPPEITAGGVISMNLQTFAEVVKLSFSYYTVMQSS